MASNSLQRPKIDPKIRGRVNQLGKMMARETLSSSKLLNQSPLYSGGEDSFFPLTGEYTSIMKQIAAGDDEVLEPDEVINEKFDREVGGIGSDEEERESFDDSAGEIDDCYRNENDTVTYKEEGEGDDKVEYECRTIELDFSGYEYKDRLSFLTMLGESLQMLTKSSDKFHFSTEPVDPNNYKCQVTLYSDLGVTEVDKTLLAMLQKDKSTQTGRGEKEKKTKDTVLKQCREPEVESDPADRDTNSKEGQIGKRQVNFTKNEVLEEMKEVKKREIDMSEMEELSFKLSKKKRYTNQEGLVRAFPQMKPASWVKVLKQLTHEEELKLKNQSLAEIAKVLMDKLKNK